MKATLNYTPAYCPNCGQPLALAGWARDDFTAGNVLTCANCGAELAYTQATAQPSSGPQGGDLYAIDTMCCNLADNLVKAAPADQWARWLVRVLKRLEFAAYDVDPDHPAGYARELNRLQEAIAARLDTELWPDRLPGEKASSPHAKLDNLTRRRNH